MLTADQTSPIHVSFTDGMKAWVEEGVLHDMDPEKKELRECRIVGLSSYPGQVLTAEILIKEKDRFATAWSDVPFHVLYGQPQRPEHPLAMEDLYYNNCPDEHITFTFFPELGKDKCRAFFKRPEKWIGGEYLGTVNWYRGNENAHIIRLNKGQFALLPNHKIQFNVGDAPAKPLPRYKKLRQNWKLQS